jgi:RNA polymerase sigma factor (sigma-70 family)
MMMMQDCELLCAWRSGDRAAGDALITRHFAAVCRFFRTKLGDDVEDLIQQTFLDLLAASSPVTSVRATLFTIARRRLLDHLRTRYQRDEVELVTSLSVADLGTSPSTAAARNEQQRLLHDALQRITLDHRMALELAYWEDLSGPEIAEILEIPEHTVRSRLARARQALRDQLEALVHTRAARQVGSQARMQAEVRDRMPDDGAADFLSRLEKNLDQLAPSHD